MKRLRMLISLLCVCTFSSVWNQASAQPRLPTPISDQLDTVKPHHRSSLDMGVIDDIDEVKRRAMSSENARVQMQQYLVMRIDELKRVCKLSAEQETELRAVVEAAIEQALAAKPTPLHSWKLDRSTSPGKYSGTVYYHGSQPAAVTQQPTWTSAIEKVLTETQKMADQEAQTKRLMLMRQIEVQTVVAAIDERLLLSVDQREKLAELIRKTFELQKSVIPPGQVFTLSGQAEMPGGVSVSLFLPHFAQQFPAEAIAKILSPAQLKRWQELSKGLDGAPVSPVIVVPPPQ